MTDRHEQARAEAEREFARRNCAAFDNEGEYLSHAWGQGFERGFTEGAAWADANPQPHTITRGQFAAAEKRYWNYVHSDGDADLALLAAFHSAGIEVTDDE